MTMYKRGGTGRTQIEEFTGEQNDGAIYCLSCTKIIFDRNSLEAGGACPYCHRDVNSYISNDVLGGDSLSDDDYDDPPLALPC